MPDGRRCRSSIPSAFRLKDGLLSRSCLQYPAPHYLVITCRHRRDMVGVLVHSQVRDWWALHQRKSSSTVALHHPRPSCSLLIYQDILNLFRLDTPINARPNCNRFVLFISISVGACAAADSCFRCSAGGPP